MSDLSDLSDLSESEGGVGAEPKYRTATAADVVWLVQLIESAYRGESSKTGWTTEAHLLDGQRTDEDDVRAVVENPDSRMIVVELDGEPVGWCQWYRWADYPAEGAAAGAADHEAGIDYAIGEPALVGRGVGTAMVGALVEEVRRIEPAAGLLVTPEAANIASRRVLEHNGFALVEVRPIDTEPHDRPMAIYRR